MSSWFRDYLFYPVSASKGMQKFTRFAKTRLGERAGRRLPVYLSMFVVWFATGVWHGASWNFIVWGLANWVVLMVSEELEPLYAKFHQRYAVKGKLWYRMYAPRYTSGSPTMVMTAASNRSATTIFLKYPHSIR